MKNDLKISLRLTLVLIVICAAVYPLLVALIGMAAPGGGKGETVKHKGKVVGYALAGQQFRDDKYFQGRPSAVNYNGAGSGGSNKGASNPDYLKMVQDRIDTFLVHNPGVQKHDIPSDLVTASGSGLDPDISPAAAFIQVNRVAAARKLSTQQVKALVEQHIERSFFAPAKVNVLQLNLALDE